MLQHPEDQAHQTSAIASPQDSSQKQITSPVLAGLSTVGAIIQGACAILVASSSLKGLVGIAALATAMQTSKVHSDAVRLPLMAISVALACLTLFVLWNGHRLRNNPSARWRKRSLARKQKIAIAFSLIASVVTLALVLSELLIHPPFEK